MLRQLTTQVPVLGKVQTHPLNQPVTIEKTLLYKIRKLENDLQLYRGIEVHSDSTVQEISPKFTNYSVKITLRECQTSTAANIPVHGAVGTRVPTRVPNTIESIIKCKLQLYAYCVTGTLRKSEFLQIREWHASLLGTTCTMCNCTGRYLAST